jgi:hypothetical protein
MKRHFRYDYLIVPCSIFWGITTILQMTSPHPYRGLIGNIIMVIGLLFYHIYAIAYRRKTVLFDPNKNNHTLNWIVLICLTAILVIMFGLLGRVVALSR